MPFTSFIFVSIERGVKLAFPVFDTMDNLQPLIVSFVILKINLAEQLYPSRNSLIALKRV